LVNGNETRTCESKCPVGYYGNRLANICQRCDWRCKKCAGSSFLCSECSFLEGKRITYFHQKEDQKCLDECGDGFRPKINQTTGEAICVPIPCEIANCQKNGCRSIDNFCDHCNMRTFVPATREWKNIIHDTQSGLCLICTDLPGILREEKDKKCYNVCGNGFLYSLGSHDPSMCDDGNNNDGDGCSSACLVEDNYVCKRGANNTPESQLPDKMNRDVCTEELSTIFEINTDNAIGKPRLDLIFNFDVCCGS
jgi:cysteine-rich repeat protein